VTTGRRTEAKRVDPNPRNTREKKNRTGGIEKDTIENAVGTNIVVAVVAVRAEAVMAMAMAIAIATVILAAIPIERNDIVDTGIQENITRGNIDERSTKKTTIQATEMDRPLDLPVPAIATMADVAEPGNAAGGRPLTKWKRMRAAELKRNVQRGDETTKREGQNLQGDNTMAMGIVSSFGTKAM